MVMVTVSVWLFLLKLFQYSLTRTLLKVYAYPLLPLMQNKYFDEKEQNKPVMTEPASVLVLSGHLLHDVV